MKKGLPQSMRTCLVYITHKMDDAIYRYLSYLMKETEGVMDMLVLYDQAFQPISLPAPLLLTASCLESMLFFVSLGAYQAETINALSYMSETSLGV